MVAATASVPLELAFLDCRELKVRGLRTFGLDIGFQIIYFVVILVAAIAAVDAV